MSNSIEQRPARVLALGGVGIMGRVAVKTLLQGNAVSKMVIADRNFASAQAFAHELSDPRVFARGLDANDPNDLRAALHDADLVVSTIGPYYRFGTKVLSAAIDTKTHYLDICDDWQPTIAMLDLDEEARKAGITALIGAGASPGISNLLAVKAVSQLEDVETLHTIWGAGSKSAESDDFSEGSAALNHWLAMLTGKVKNQRGGTLVDVPPFQKLKIDYPGIGRVGVFTVGHPEPISFSRSFPRLRDSVNAMDMPVGVIWLLRAITRQIDSDRISLDDGVKYVQKVFLQSSELGLSGAIREMTRFNLAGIAEAISRKKYLPTLCAYAKGKSDGRSVRVGASMRGDVPGGMAAITGIPAAVMAQMLIAGEITRRGVFAPETGVDPDSFFARFAPFTTTPTLGAGLVKVARDRAA